MGLARPPPEMLWLVELRDMCYLPSPSAYSNITTDFILFGPFHNQHHANFGPFTELDDCGAWAGKDLIEAHLSLKLARCAQRRSEHDILSLLDHPRLVHWAVQQHSTIRAHENSGNSARIRLQRSSYGQKLDKIARLSRRTC